MLSSRLLTAVTHLQSAFEEARGYAKYHPSRGYWWDFSAGKNTTQSSINTQLGNMGANGAKNQAGGANTPNSNGTSSGNKKVKKKSKNKEGSVGEREEPSSIFQRKRVDMLLDLWMRNFPPKAQGGTVTTAVAASAVSNASTNVGQGDKADETKSEKSVEAGSANLIVKSETHNSNAANVGGDSGQRGVKREANTGTAQNRTQQETKKMKPS